MSKRKKILTALLVLILSFIWINSMLSREASQAFSDWVKDIVFAVLGIEKTGGEGVIPIRKIAHFLEFAALGADLALLLDDIKMHYPKAFLLSAFAAAIDENIQYFSGRGNSMKDVFLDSCGGLFGILVVFAVVSVMAAARGKKPNT